MNAGFKTALRTVQVNFPMFVDAKFEVMRRYRQMRGVAFDRDFDAIRLFPIPDGAVFLDVGANRGQSTDAFRMMARNCCIHLFEPNLGLCAKLRRQFRESDHLVIHEYGLGNATSERLLYIPFYRGWMFDGLASFDREKASRWLERRILGYNDKHLSVRAVTCRVRCLDDLGLAPFFVKVDVQGCEWEVVQGGQDTIRTHEPVLLLESPPHPNTVSILGSMGYAFYAFRNQRFIRGVSKGNNTFFMTPKTASLVRAHIVQ